VATDATGNVYAADLSNNIQKFTSSGTYLAQWGSSGSGSGQFQSPTGVATDAAGNVYVSEYGNSRIQKFALGAQIALVSDIGNDQGKQVRLRILRMSADAGTGPRSPATGFIAAWIHFPARRSRRARRGLSGALDAAPADIAGAQLAGWEQVATIAARGDAEYVAVVPTLANSNSSGLYYTAFMVSAMTADPLTYFDSAVQYGYSVDNLSPPARPAPGGVWRGAAILHWGVNSASDFATFRLYRGASADFAPGAETGDRNDRYRIREQRAAGGIYKLSAVDLNGNETCTPWSARTRP
jgi:hypothetical protein